MWRGEREEAREGEKQQQQQKKRKRMVRALSQSDDDADGLVLAFGALGCTYFRLMGLAAV